MSANIIDGKAIGNSIRGELKKEIETLKEKHNIVPGLAVVLVGENPASKVYVGMKEKACASIGVFSDKHVMSAESSTEELLALIDKLNKDYKINGILVQLPLPKQIDENAVLEAILPEKDVDGFHPYNAGKLMIGNSPFPPCTPFGVIKLLEYSNIPIEGKKAVIIGRSNIVGKPVALLLLQRHATVTICHSRTKNLAEEVRQADIIVAAIGKANFVTKEMVKPGAVVIDVGVNRMEDKTLAGDVDFDAVKEVASAITPVPGGVGPMTITMLLSNTVKSAKASNNIE